MYAYKEGEDTMEYFHLVTRKPMYKGQIVDFSNGEHNRLYDFWMKREERTAEGRDIFDILRAKDVKEQDMDVVSAYVNNWATCDQLIMKAIAKEPERTLDSVIESSVSIILVSDIVSPPQQSQHIVPSP